MDSIFEEETEEVGAEIEAYCPSPRCKADVTHTVVSVFEGEVRRVQCSVCGDVHAYRKPRGDAAEEAAEAVPKRAPIKRGTWDENIARTPDAELANCRPYSIRDTYEEGDVMHHPLFDIGFVVELLPDNKMEVLFKDEARVLVHNRVDLVARMPELADIPAPREMKKKKRAAAKADAGPVRAKADVAKAVEMARQAAQTKVAEANQKKKASKKLAAKAPGKAPVKSTAKAVKKPVAKPVKAAKKPASKAKPVVAKAKAKPVMKTKVKAAPKKGKPKAKPTKGKKR